MINDLQHVQTKRDVVMLLWKVHNKINMVVDYEIGKAENQGWYYGDPAFPHIVWPPVKLCRECYNDGVEAKGITPEQQGLIPNQVYLFLQRYYGSIEREEEVPSKWPWFPKEREEIQADDKLYTYEDADTFLYEYADDPNDDVYTP